jgi:hypothetical protein
VQVPGALASRSLSLATCSIQTLEHEAVVVVVVVVVMENQADKDHFIICGRGK